MQHLAKQYIIIHIHDTLAFHILTTGSSTEVLLVGETRSCPFVSFSFIAPAAIVLSSCCPEARSVPQLGYCPEPLFRFSVM